MTRISACRPGTILMGISKRGSFKEYTLAGAPGAAPASAVSNIQAGAHAPVRIFPPPPDPCARRDLAMNCNLAVLAGSAPDAHPPPHRSWKAAGVEIEI